jgi:hypothetical protein
MIDPDRALGAMLLTVGISGIGGRPKSLEPFVRKSILISFIHPNVLKEPTDGSK